LEDLKKTTNCCWTGHVCEREEEEEEEEEEKDSLE